MSNLINVGLNQRIIVKTVVIVLIVFFIGMAIANIQLCASINNLSKVKDKEFKAKIAKERDLILKDIAEKNAKDAASYYELAKQLESQKKMVKDLENQAKTQPSATHPARGLKK